MSSIAPTTVTLRTCDATIRTAHATDAEGVLALRIATAAETDFLTRRPDEIRRTAGDEASRLAHRLSSPSELFVVAATQGRVIGLASLRGSTLTRFEHGATLGLAVLQEFWGQGLGRALMHALLSWADSRGLVRVALEVVESNTRAIRLYESLGFEHEGRLRAARKQGETYLDNCLMSRIRRR